MSINGKTKIIAIFGDPVEHTLSPAMHNAAFAATGIDCVYVPFHVRPDNLGDAVRGLKAMGFAGANITVPHKESVIKFLDGVDVEAGRLGAVNTIVNEGGALIGYNTDGRGFVRSLKEEGGLDPDGKRVFVCGAGGAARGIGFALSSAGAAEISFFDVDKAKLGRLVDDINGAFGRTVAVAAGLDPDYIKERGLVVNATPLGMHAGDPRPLPDGSFREGQIVYDIIYNPAVTVTMRQAEGAGARVQNGLGMLLYQGVLAFEHWMGVAAPVETMREALLKGLQAKG
ncbi:MAG TPA: shikimate dehydrogenase [Nitrospirota bacterium]